MSVRPLTLFRLSLTALLVLTGTSRAAWGPSSGIIPPSKVLAFKLQRDASPLGYELRAPGARTCRLGGG